MSLEGVVPPMDAPQDVVDLTVDDNASPATVPPAKKRKSAKREALEANFKQRLQSLNKLESESIIRSFAVIRSEKDDINRMKRPFAESLTQIDPTRSASQTNRLKFFKKALLVLNDALWNLAGIEEQVLTGTVGGYDAYRLSEKAKTIANAGRGRVASLRQERATKQLQARAVEATREQLMTDRAYVDARSNSMVTPAATTTRSAYRPDINPPASNQEMLKRAFQDPAFPGLLPDGQFIPPELQDRYASGEYAIQRAERDYAGVATPYSIRANNLSDDSNDEEYEGDGSTEEQQARKYASLVDMALTEAEPLDMPPQLNCTPLEHQRQGLGWLVRAEKGRYRGSILADDMGLGKTVQTIALMYANPPDVGNDPDNRLVLVVCPVALISTWTDELKQRVHEQHRPRVYIHHKGMNPTDYTTDIDTILDTADVVICSYQGIVSEFRQIEKMRTAEAEGKRLPESGPTPLSSIRWYRVILDEAHTIKNRNSFMAKGVSELHAQLRLALTGTPMQNNLEELYSLVRFLRIRPYSTFQQFKQLIPATQSSDASEYESQKALAAFLSAVMLRRKKDTKINGRKIIDNLPPKHVNQLNVEMDDKTGEQAAYAALESKIRKEVNQISTTEEVTMSNMLTFLLRMRQTACHPDLIAITKAAGSHRVWGNNKHTINAIKMAMAVPQEIRAFALSVMDDEGLCASCDGDTSSPADTLVMGGCGHLLCAECSVTAVEDLKAESAAMFCPRCETRYRLLANLEIVDVIEDFCPQTVKAALDSLLAKQRPRVERLRAEENARKQRLRQLTEGNTTSIDDLFVSDGEYFSDGTDSDFDAKAGSTPVQDDRITAASNSPFVSAVGDLKIESNATSGQVSGGGSVEALSVEEQKPSIAQDTESTSSSQGLKYNLDIDEIARLFKVPGIFTDGWRSSTKVETCLNTLAKIWAEFPDDKVIIFSSFVSLLDVLTIPLEAAQVPHALYTGGMNVPERNATLENFRNGRCKVLLTSLKAGNVGLTLTQANRVIILEPFWNPYVEDQAQDRVYRIGQSREVYIYKLRIKHTVEDRIVTLQDNKRTIIESALDNSTKTRSRGLSRTDIMYALGLRRQPRPVQAFLNRPPEDP